MKRVMLTVFALAAILVASGCVTIGGNCYEVERIKQGDIGASSTIDVGDCGCPVTEQARILHAHWETIDSQSMDGVYVITCECCQFG